MTFRPTSILLSAIIAHFLIQTFVQGAGPYSVERKLVADDLNEDNFFGWSVAIDGNVALVGALDNAASNDSAYLFNSRSGEQLFKLLPDNPDTYVDFGYSVALDDQLALVSAITEVSGGIRSGSAYVYDVATGARLQKLLPADPINMMRFGRSVGISGNKAIVGTFDGAAYLFDATSGSQLFKLTASDAAADDRFGDSVSISGNIAIVGAPHDDDHGLDSGSAYLFDVNTGNQIAKLTASDAFAGSVFGVSVSISENVAIVGSLGDNEAADAAGAAYIFDVTTGAELAKLTAPDAQVGDAFGASVSISGSRAIVGTSDSRAVSSAYVFDVNTGGLLAKLTPSEDDDYDVFGSSVGISGGSAILGAIWNDQAGLNAGAAYVYSTVPEPSSILMFGLGAIRLLLYRNGRD